MLPCRRGKYGSYTEKSQIILYNTKAKSGTRKHIEKQSEARIGIM
jgi:hypothetical protein